MSDSSMDMSHDGTADERVVSRTPPQYHEDEEMSGDDEGDLHRAQDFIQRNNLPSGLGDIVIENVEQIQNLVTEGKERISQFIRYPHSILTNHTETKFYELAAELLEDAGYESEDEDAIAYFTQEAAAAQKYGQQLGRWTRSFCSFLYSAQRIAAEIDTELRKLMRDIHKDGAAENSQKTQSDKPLILPGISIAHKQQLGKVLTLLSTLIERATSLDIGVDTLLGLKRDVELHPEFKYIFSNLDQGNDLRMMTELKRHRQFKICRFLSGLKTVTQREIKDTDRCPICCCPPLDTHGEEEDRPLVEQMGFKFVDGERFIDFTCPVEREEDGLVIMAGKDGQDVVVERKCLMEWLDNSDRCPLTGRILF